MPKLIVDADACPRNVLLICKDAAAQYGYELYTVANYHHRIESDHHIVVGGEPQEADIRIANLVQTGDVVVTHDLGLAALVLGKAAAVLSPGGRKYRAETIEFQLEEREVKAQIRRSGGRTKGPKPRTREQDQAFAAALKHVLSRSRTQ